MGSLCLGLHKSQSDDGLNTRNSRKTVIDITKGKFMTSNYHNASMEDVAIAIVDRLIDNYEDKGEFITEFYELAELIGKAIANSNHFNRIEEIAMENGVIESDYFEGEE